MGRCFTYASIFSSARASGSPSCSRCAPIASAWNSRLRDSAICIIPAAIGARMAMASAPNALPPSRSLPPPRAASFRPEIEVNGLTTRVLVEHVGAVDAQRLGDLAAHLSPEELWGVDDALRTVL